MNLIGGWLYDHVNSSVPFYFGSAMALIASVIMIGLFRVKPRNNQQPGLPGMHS